MKRILLLLAAGSFSVAAMAQLQASTEPSNRNVLLEDLTGVFCGYCPDGAKKADQYRDANPGRVVLIGNHSGGYANPGSTAGYVDFRTQEGAAIDGPSLKRPGGNGGYPAGLINRTANDYTYDPGFPGTSRSYWTTVGNVILNEPSPVNLIAEAYYFEGEDVVHINVAGYYTDNGDGADYLNVAILQDNLESYQSGGSTFYPERINGSTGLYRQMDVLRNYVTADADAGDFFGEEIANTATGTAFNRSYEYTVGTVNLVDANTADDPEANVEDMKVVVFMSTESGYSEVITAIEVEVGQRTVGVEEFTGLKDVKVYPNPFETTATVQLNLTSSEEIAINVFDITGKTVYAIPSRTYAAGQRYITLDGSNLNAGVYYMNVVSANGTMTKKLVLNK